MYEISRENAHKAAKENLEEQKDRQEDYYDKKSKYRTLTLGPGHHLLPQPAAGHQFEISHLLENIHSD
jgi:beta-galactosidase beta subunit